jgi:hypothetical protein
MVAGNSLAIPSVTKFPRGSLGWAQNVGKPNWGKRDAFFGGNASGNRVVRKDDDTPLPLNSLRTA